MSQDFDSLREDKKALIYQLNNQHESIFYSFVKKYQKVINKKKVDRSLFGDALLLRDEISQKINSSLTRLAINWVYFDPKSSINTFFCMFQKYN